MNDRELLEYAAKAAGITLKPMEIKNVTYQGDDRFIGYMADSEQCPRGWFNPLTDDGDALRLAVKLKFGVDIEQDYTAVLSRDKITCIIDRSTRRAIVRAAAEIGKAMP